MVNKEYILKRLGLAVLVMFGVYTIGFTLTFVAPGNPAQAALGQKANKEAVEALEEQWGLNEPLPVQYKNYLINFINLDWGESFRYRGESVTGILASRYPKTMYYAVWSLVFAIVMSIPLGLIAAYKQNTWVDNLSVLVSQVGISIPNFWLGMLIIAILAVWLDLISVVPDVPTGSLWSFPGFFTHVTDYFGIIITLGTALMARNTRMTRSSTLDVLSEEYITMARAKGLKERTVVLKHALRNALIPVVTSIGFNLLLLFGGAVVVETVFGLNGIGKLYIDSIIRRDYPIIIALLLTYTIGVVFVNLIIDISYSVIDPRVQLR
ncbi:hypothetical protein C9439_01035 [archaeon SCG-AAA382B04]|nr:hypothetical protein C9439_01035 [archaeon SCG-AAA382B04]